MKPPRVLNANFRRVVRDTIQPRIAKAQLRRSLVTGKAALREIDALLWCLGELNGLPDGPDNGDDE